MAFSKRKEKKIFDNAGGKCEKCGKQIVFENRTKGERGAWNAHHKNHVSSGGSDTASNGKALCIDCHFSIHYG